MPILLLQWLIRQHRHWILPAGIVVTVFLTSWALMAIAEPDSDIVAPQNYWWWFLITTTTVGYGDYFPTELGGKLVALYVILGGLTTVTVIIAQVSTALENVRGRRMKGQQAYTGSGHTVILGYAVGRTDRLIQTLLDDDPTRKLVLAAFEDQADEHPMPAEPRVHFVRGDLIETELLGSTALASAQSVLIEARDDNEAVTLAVAVTDVAPDVHTVVGLRDVRRARTISRVSARAHCIAWHATMMLVEELQDPGISAVYAELTEPGGASTFSALVPANADRGTYGEWQGALGRAHGATLLAVRDDDGVRVSTEWTRPVLPGSRLYYISHRRLSDSELTSALR